MKYFATPEELALFEPLELWVLKESYVKLLGLTIAAIRPLRFARDGDGSPVLVEGQGDRPHVLSRLYRVDGCPAAVCSFHEQPPDSIGLVSCS
jgi:phosphopantetheinyl transferase